MFHINYFTYLNKTLNSNNNLNCNANWPTILLPPRVYLHEINFKHEMSKNRRGKDEVDLCAVRLSAAQREYM